MNDGPNGSSASPLAELDAAPSARAAARESIAVAVRYLPDPIRAARRWLLHNARKLPFYVDGEARSGELDAPADVARLASLDEALAALRRAGRGWGLGLALGFDEHLGASIQGVDFDHVAGDDGHITDPIYASIYRRLGGYAERSPSGDGLHVLGLGRPFSAIRWPHPRAKGAPGIECYSAGRYFTVTGDLQRQAEVVDLHDVVEALRVEFAARSDRPVPASAVARRPERDRDTTTRNIDAWCRDHPIEVELERRGFKRYGARWLSPHSTSGVPGVRVVDGERAVSFHASDDGIGTHCAESSCSVFDPFDLAVHFDFGGDRIRALRELLPRSAPSSRAPGARARETSAAKAPDEPGPSGVASASGPQGVAMEFIAQRYTFATGPGLWYWQGAFHAYNGAHWELLHDPDIRAQVYEHLGMAAKKRQVDEVLDALRAKANLTNRCTPPAWVPKVDGDPGPGELVPVSNGLLRIADRALLPPSARYFTTWGLPFAYAPDAPAPVRWIAFLEQLFPGDPASTGLLQEYAGYLVSGSTALQKALALIGPKRSGKGTVGRVLTALIGPDNVVSPTLSSLGTPFGLQALIGRTLMLIADARLSSNVDVSTTVENLLRITGEDVITIPRKFLPDYTATLGTRVVVLSNEAPRFTDASGALPSRFLVLTTTATFYGQENPRLTAELLAELPGIFNWALDGLDRLLRRGHFVQPAGGSEVVDEMEWLASPMTAFIDEECRLEAGFKVQCADLYAAWAAWCERNGRKHPGTLQGFGRDLRAACAQVSTKQVREPGTGARSRWYQGIRLRTAEDDQADASAAAAAALAAQSAPVPL